MALNKLFKSGIALPENNANELEKTLIEGEQFFKKFNETRMQLAFSTFTPDMKKALYEVIYFLHVNDPSFENIEYRGIKKERISGIVRESEYHASANLYAPETLHGVAGIDKLPQTYRDEFHEYVTSEYGIDPQKKLNQEHNPIVSISSLGSIGTIGHKPEKSDLDLQILYDLTPFKINIDEWTDMHLKDALSQEIKSWIFRLSIQQRINIDGVSRGSTLYKKLKQDASITVGKTYPYLYQTFFNKKDFTSALTAPSGRQLKMNIILEMMALISGAIKQENTKGLLNQERALKKRIQAIQDYIQAKFPQTELYLFSCDSESFRNGQHGTTLESKEASGSAYELILNYEVLMPGIQFGPNIPSHFIISNAFNNSPQFYERTMNFIRFGCLPIYSRINNYLVDMGATPNLSMSYMLSHMGAAYWESFKAASGNLPKALLNLFRIEVLYNPKYLITLINIIKSPQTLDQIIETVDQKPTLNTKLTGNKFLGISVEDILFLEKELPVLRIDPWWLKYKVLKVFFSDPKVDIEHSERRSISRNIDLCFALHIKLSHAFNHKKPRSHREKFLILFLKKAFPQGSPQRHKIEQIFQGDVQIINRFEKDLKSLFTNCLDRIHKIIALKDIPDASNHAEFEIWYHYFQQNFDYEKSEIPKNILSHLKVPRTHIRVHNEKSRRRGSWVFNGSSGNTEVSEDQDSIQKTSTDVDLIYEMSFLKGLAYCILNGYYGLLQEGSQKESKTKIEINLGAIDLGNVIDNHWSIIDSEAVTRLADRITDFFPYTKTHYMDCVRLKREVEEIFFFLHLFKFGQLSILYRDNLQSWSIAELEHPDLALNAQTYFDKHYDFLNHPDLHRSIDTFLKDNKINLANSKVKMDFWYNFMATGHSPTLGNLHREKTFSWQFKDIFEKKHSHKNYSSSENLVDQFAVKALRVS